MNVYNEINKEKLNRMVIDIVKNLYININEIFRICDCREYFVKV